MAEKYDDWKIRLASFAGSMLIRLLGFTARFEVVGYERVREIAESGRSCVMAVWHGRTMMPVYYCRGMGIWAIVSTSRDGELQARVLQYLGYRIIRGSTARGGIKAALIAARKLQEGGILAITPDGPRGPAHQVQEGIVFLAQKANCPIVPIGVGIRPRKLMPTWDSYALPAPFARCALVFGEPIDLSDYRETHEPLADIVKKALREVQLQAEQMVKESR